MRLSAIGGMSWILEDAKGGHTALNERWTSMGRMEGKKWKGLREREPQCIDHRNW